MKMKKWNNKTRMLFLLCLSHYVWVAFGNFVSEKFVLKMFRDNFESRDVQNWFKEEEKALLLSLREE